MASLQVGAEKGGNEVIARLVKRVVSFYEEAPDKIVIWACAISVFVVAVAHCLSGDPP